MKRFVPILAAASFAVVSASASAQAQPQAAAPQPIVVNGNKTPVVGDPNEVVCEKMKVLGSRLAVKKVCKTRSEWQYVRFNDRMEIDKAQVQKGSCQGCAGGGGVDFQ